MDDMQGRGRTRPADTETDADVAHAIAEALAGRSIVTAESCTAGRVAAAFTTVGSASDFLRGGLVAYHDDVKRSTLGVVAESVYSEQAVAEMARGVRSLLHGDVAVATSGVVGDDPVDGVAPGTVFVATCVGDAARTARHHFDGSPDEVCAAAVRQALHDLLDHITADAARAT